MAQTSQLEFQKAQMTAPPSGIGPYSGMQYILQPVEAPVDVTVPDYTNLIESKNITSSVIEITQQEIENEQTHPLHYSESLQPIQAPITVTVSGYTGLIESKTITSSVVEITQEEIENEQSHSLHHSRSLHMLSRKAKQKAKDWEQKVISDLVQHHGQIEAAVIAGSHAIAAGADALNSTGGLDCGLLAAVMAPTTFYVTYQEERNKQAAGDANPLATALDVAEHLLEATEQFTQS